MQFDRIAIDKIYKRRDRYDIPDWQRSKVWSLDKQRKLIDSILRGWQLPKFYFQKTGTNTVDVVDGQQRLAAIWGFCDGEIELSKASAEKFGAKRYEELPDDVADRFDDYDLHFDLIIEATDEEIKEFFQRLQEGLPLTSSEKLNSIHSNLRDFCANLADHAFFPNSTTIANRRHAYFDVCAKVMAIEIEGLSTGVRLADVSAIFKSQEKFSAESAVALRVLAALDALVEAFPAKSIALRQRSMVQSVVTLTCRLFEADMTADQMPVVRAFIEDFSQELLKQVELGQAATDSDYLAFQRTVNANVRSGAKQRHAILLRKLLARKPDLFSDILHSEQLTGSIAADIEQHSHSIRSLIKSVNDAYAATQGGDLFKATNKTATALASIGRSLKSAEDYKDWVDDLYFVFRESVGQRLTSVPQAFADVNNLRTQLQHDVDHGKGVAAKKKKLAATFAKYAGGVTPGSLPPGKFPLLQANLLGALASDLRSLQKTLT